MPSAAIMSANSGDKYKEPHERKNGPWSDWEKAEGARHLDHAEKISKNKKFLEAIEQHSKERAHEHYRTAHHAAQLAKSGRISPKAMKKLEK